MEWENRDKRNDKEHLKKVSVSFIQQYFRIIFCQGNLFFIFYADRMQVLMIVFVVRTYWDAIYDFIMGKYFHKRLREYYPQSNPSDQTYFLKESSLYVCNLLLIISLFFKVYIFPQVLQICHLVNCILLYFDFVFFDILGLLVQLCLLIRRPYNFGLLCL